MVYSPTGSGNVRIDQVLTNISLGFPRNTDYVGNLLFPQVKVTKQSDKYYVFGKEAWLAENGDYRAPGTEANEIPGMQVSLDSYYAQEHALQHAIPDEERENTESPFQPDKDAAELLTGKILLGRELAMRDLVTNASNYASGLSTTLAGTQQFSNPASDPIGVIKGAVEAVHDKLFMEPNTMIMPRQVYRKLVDHPAFIERIKYSERGVGSLELIKELLEFDNIIVPGVAYSADPVGTPGNKVKGSYLWGKDIVMAYVPPAPGKKVPAFGYEYTWTINGQEMSVDRWREDPRVSDLIRLRRRYDLKLTGVEIDPDSPDFGKSISGYLIKNAVA